VPADVLGIVIAGAVVDQDVAVAQHVDRPAVQWERARGGPGGSVAGVERAFSDSPTRRHQGDAGAGEAGSEARPVRQVEIAVGLAEPVEVVHQAAVNRIGIVGRQVVVRTQAFLEVAPVRQVDGQRRFAGNNPTSPSARPAFGARYSPAHPGDELSQCLDKPSS
jgi:hypothetical protein